MKEMSENRDFVKLEVSTRANSGIISRLFGSEAGAQARSLPGGGYGPGATDRFMEEVIDGD
jgi:hypothetical protein